MRRQLWLITTILSFLLLAAPASAQTAPDTATLRGIEAQVAQIRGLQPLSEPNLQLLDHTSLHTYLEDEFATNYLASERAADQQELVALGLIQPTDDIVQINLNLLTDQVIGVYDTDLKSLFVVNDQEGFGPVARITYAHEFNHALQDQYYDLNRIAPKHQNNNDRSLAVHGLIEGDAILLQSLWAQKNLTPEDLILLARDTGSDAGLADVPLVVRAELLFPYTDGFNFVRQAYRQTGSSYTAVDSLFQAPPESTAQILHPEKYRERVHPVDVPLGDVASALGADWTTVGTGVLGELDTRVLLEQWGLPRVEASRVAAGWSGDRWTLVSRNGQSAIAVKSTWASATAASDFFTAYTRGLARRFSDAVVVDSSTTRQALTSTSNATDVRLDGSDIVVVIATDRDTASAVAAAITSPFAP